MASDEDDLRLNTLHRFAKSSPRLQLQVHSHCEVPAGCGGVVLRWVDPAAGVSAIVSLTPVASVEAFVDGVKLATTRAQLGFGSHVLALRLKPSPISLQPQGLARFVRGSTIVRPFGCAVVSDAPPFSQTARPALPTTQDDGSWRALASAPLEGWSTQSFDDRSWPALHRSEADVTRFPSDIRWRYQRLTELAMLLELPEGEEIWVRHLFEVRRAP